MIEIKDFSDWSVSTKFSDGSGRSEKLWLEHDKCIGLFKFPKIHNDLKTTYEHVSEKLASDLAGILDIKCANVDIGTYNGRIGSMSYLVMDYQKEILMEGLDIITVIHPSYNSNTLVDEETGSKYSFEMAIKALNLVSDFHSMYHEMLIFDFVKILVFDFLIGNSDRHHSNWAIVYNNAFFRSVESERYNYLPIISPIYDNGSSLCALEREENINTILKDGTRFRSMYTTKSKAMFFSEEGKRLTHEQLLDDIFINKKIDNSYVRFVCSTLSDEILLKLLSNYDNILSEERITLIFKFLQAKVDLLKKYLKG